MLRPRAASPMPLTASRNSPSLSGFSIFDMDLEFLTGGPVYERPYELPTVSTKAKEVFPVIDSDKDAILAML